MNSVFYFIISIFLNLLFCFASPEKEAFSLLTAHTYEAFQTLVENCEWQKNELNCLKISWNDNDSSQNYRQCNRDFTTQNMLTVSSVEGSDPPKQSVLGMTLNWIWWWACTSEDLKSVEYSIRAINPTTTLTWSISILYGPFYLWNRSVQKLLIFDWNT